MKDAARGVILVLVTSAVLMVIPEGLVLPLVAIFMGVASGVYVGFALKDPEAKEAPIQWEQVRSCSPWPVRWGYGYGLHPGGSSPRGRPTRFGTTSITFEH